MPRTNKTTRHQLVSAKQPESEANIRAANIRAEADRKLAADRARVMKAMRELLRNPETPASLWNYVSEFVTEQSNECGEELYQSPYYLTQILESVKPGERIGAVNLAREFAERGAR